MNVWFILGVGLLALLFLASMQLTPRAIWMNEWMKANPRDTTKESFGVYLKRAGDAWREHERDLIDKAEWRDGPRA